ncbi:MAG: hypothetical protein HYT79_07135 [Elusimicrobia bacterium]|nr:hypothetical protein [Elusimicrobiota bacterium]
MVGTVFLLMLTAGIHAGELADAVGGRIDACRAEGFLEESSVLVSSADLPEESALRDLLPGVSADDVESMNCLVLEHILATQRPCPYRMEAAQETIRGLAERISGRSADFRSMKAAVGPISVRIHDFNGPVPMGRFRPSEGDILMNALWSCTLRMGEEQIMARQLAAETLTHEYFHAYVHRILGENTYTSTEEAMATVLGFHFARQAGLTGGLNCGSMDLGLSRLASIIKEGSCQKIDWLISGSWESFIEWSALYCTDEDGVVECNRGSFIYASRPLPGDADNCQRARHYLKRALYEMEGGASPMSDFRQSLRFARSCPPGYP